jgi:DNA-binding LytR/AlgR family response regulator
MPTTTPREDAPLRALVVDDEAPTLAELTYLLGQDPRIGTLHTAASGTEALRALEEHPVDVVFCDISMPGLDGLDLARVLARFAERPQVVFVAAHGEPPRAGAAVDEDETIPVELGGVTRFIQRSQIRYASAHGDYARMHTGEGSHLVRVSLNALEERWGDKGFVRIHRSTLVALPHVTAVSTDAGHTVVRVGDVELPVSRRHTRSLRDRLLRPATR